MSSIELQSAEEQTVRSILAELIQPPEIIRIDTRFGVDSTGDPAIWLTFHIDDKVVLNSDDVDRLTKYLYQVTDALLRHGVAGFPYTKLEQAA